jgi:hypothetical protein
MPGDQFSEPVYEMLWDCPACGSEKLLGKTHRYCPSCGSPQDPDRRYFPPEDEKVPVQDHVFYGVDRSCPACETPNSANSSNCGSCGSPLEEGAQVKKVQDGPKPEQPQAAGTEPAKKSRKGLFGCLALVLVIIAGVLVVTQWTQTSTFTVQGHSWERTVQIEVFKSVSESGWCDSKPAAAKFVHSKSKERSTQQVPDGEICTNKNVDNGDGTFRKVKECKPKTKSVPVYDDWCTYTVDRWKNARVAKAAAKGLDPSPSWPQVKVDGCRHLGCEREGKRSEKYQVILKDPDGGTHDCDKAQPRWSEMAVGSSWAGETTVIGGMIDCESLLPQ